MAGTQTHKAFPENFNINRTGRLFVGADGRLLIVDHLGTRRAPASAAVLMQVQGRRADGFREEAGNG